MKPERWGCMFLMFVEALGITSVFSQGYTIDEGDTLSLMVPQVSYKDSLYSTRITGVSGLPSGAVFTIDLSPSTDRSFTWATDFNDREGTYILKFSRQFYYNYWRPADPYVIAIVVKSSEKKEQKIEGNTGKSDINKQSNSAALRLPMDKRGWPPVVPPNPNRSVGNPDDSISSTTDTHSVKIIEE